MSVKSIAVILEIVAAGFFVLPIFSNIINPGNIAGIIICGLLLAATIFHEKLIGLIFGLWKYNSGKVLLLFVGAILTASVIYAVVLTFFMIKAQTDKPENPDAVIVLGCKVNGNTPSRMLKRRLDSAVIYLNKNEDVVCIVSGGKGEDEKISEAQAMKEYLVDKGIDEGRILTEDKSVNTLENIKNSVALLGGNGSGEIAIITDGFHQYRAGYIAESFGYDAAAINAQTDFFNAVLMPTYYIREWMAITNEYFKNLR